MFIFVAVSNFTDINECDVGICENGGICTNSPGNFICSCMDNFVGKRCQSGKVLTLFFAISEAVLLFGVNVCFNYFANW